MTIPKPSLLEWVYIAAGVFLTMAYFWFMDDAFIFYRYVDNYLLLKIGLVYNAGEFVEGFSSPGWLVLLTMLRSMGFSYLTITVLLAIVCFAVFALFAVRLNRDLSGGDGGGKSPIVNVPLGYLVGTYGVCCYFSSGLETPLVQVYAVVFALYILHPGSVFLQLLAGTAPFVRPELLVALVLCAGWGLFKTRRLPLWAMLSCFGTLGPWLLFRIYYYADLLPNTYYLKDGRMIEQGFVYLHDTLLTYHFYPLAAVFVVLALLLRRKQVDIGLSPRVVMLAVALVMAAYAVKIGGDARHYRYLAFPFCLAVLAFGGLLEKAWGSFASQRGKWIPCALALGAAVGVHLCYPPQLSSHPLYSTPEFALVGKISDAEFHRRHSSLEHDNWGPKTRPEAQRTFRARNPKFRYRRTITSEWCELAYERFRARVIHPFGLTEPILARTEMASTRPGHKYGLKPLAEDLVNVHRKARPVGRWMYRRAVKEGIAPDWIRRNLDTIEIIERKIYNKHDFFENLKLAFTFPGKIQP